MTDLTIASLFPLDTVAAGDEANAAALVRRARQRDISATLTTINRPEAMRSARIYLLGGDGLAGVVDLVTHLHATHVADEVRSGEAIIFAVDAGLAAVGQSWTDRDGETHDGLGLIEITALSTAPSVASVRTRPAPEHGLPAMTGWHSHAFQVTRDPHVPRLTEIVAGDARTAPFDDGVVTPLVIGTQLHGPVLALNPELADLVLASALGLGGWDPLPIECVDTARARRIAELQAHPAGARGSSFGQLIRRHRRG
jgi:CobQ-like glutamine amidotransferase family enzyme